MNWQPGEYCLLKYRSCPAGFKPGTIYFDDEDSKNANAHGGVLPDIGASPSGTTLHFCCRSDGNNVVPIFLPTTKPFYLLQATRWVNRSQTPCSFVVFFCLARSVSTGLLACL